MMFNGIIFWWLWSFLEDRFPFQLSLGGTFFYKQKITYIKVIRRQFYIIFDMQIDCPINYIKYMEELSQIRYVISWNHYRNSFNRLENVKSLSTISICGSCFALFCGSCGIASWSLLDLSSIVSIETLICTATVVLLNNIWNFSRWRTTYIKINWN